MPTLPISPTSHTCRLGPGFTPTRVEYERLVPSGRLSIPGPTLQVRYRYPSYEPSTNHELLEHISGDWNGTLYMGQRSGRITALYVLIPEAPFVMKARIKSMFQAARRHFGTDACHLNYRLAEDVLDLNTFAHPGHWLLEVMFPTS